MVSYSQGDGLNRKTCVGGHVGHGVHVGHVGHGVHVGHGGHGRHGGHGGHIKLKKKMKKGYLI